MRHHSLTLATALIATLTATGCAKPDSAQPADINWEKVAGRDLNCPDDKVHLVAPPDKYDIDGDGENEYFVTIQCNSTKHPNPEPGQLEIYRAGATPDQPAWLATIVRDRQNLQLTGCVSFVRGQAYTRASNGTIWASSRWTPGKLPTGFLSASQGQITGCPVPAA